VFQQLQYNILTVFFLFVTIICLRSFNFIISLLELLLFFCCYNIYVYGVSTASTFLLQQFVRRCFNIAFMVFAVTSPLCCSAQVGRGLGVVGAN